MRKSVYNPAPLQTTNIQLVSVVGTTFNHPTEFRFPVNTSECFLQFKRYTYVGYLLATCVSKIFVIIKLKLSSSDRSPCVSRTPQYIISAKIMLKLKTLKMYICCHVDYHNREPFDSNTNKIIGKYIKNKNWRWSYLWANLLRANKLLLAKCARYIVGAAAGQSHATNGFLN